MNAVRTKLFEKKYTKEGKAIDMSLLPPCNSVLVLDIKQANYVVKISKFSLTNWLHSDAISENGWLPDNSSYWVDYTFPRDVDEILCDSSFITDDFNKFDEQDQLSNGNDEN